MKRSPRGQTYDYMDGNYADDNDVYGKYDTKSRKNISTYLS